eukprot:7384619-Prymnesium_polylepis.1
MRVQNGNPVDSTGNWGSRQTNLIVALFASSRHDCVMLQKSLERLIEKPLSYVTEIRSTPPEIGGPGKLILYMHASPVVRGTSTVMCELERDLDGT